MRRSDTGGWQYKTALLLALLVLAGALALIRTNSSFPVWTATHWLFNYDHGFIKRGLIGTLLFMVNDTITAATIQYLHVAVATITTLAFVALAFAVLSASMNSGKGAERKGVWITAAAFGCLLLSSPGTIQQWYHDPGRFDAFGFLLIMISLFLTSRGSKAVGLLAAFACSAIAVLIHEAFFLWVAPMCVGLWLWRHGTRAREMTMAIGVAVTLTALTAVVGIFNYAGYMDFDAAKAALQNRANFEIEDLSLMIHYRNFNENLTYTSELAWTSRRLAWLGIGAAFLIALFGFVLRLFSRSGVRADLPVALLLLACFAPLALLALGHDQGRWFAMLNCNLVILLLAWLMQKPERIRGIAWPDTRLMIVVIAGQFALGPFGVVTIFPAIQH